MVEFLQSSALKGNIESKRFQSSTTLHDKMIAKEIEQKSSSEKVSQHKKNEIATHHINEERFSHDMTKLSFILYTLSQPGKIDNVVHSGNDTQSNKTI